MARRQTLRDLPSVKAAEERRITETPEDRGEAIHTVLTEEEANMARKESNEELPVNEETAVEGSGIVDESEPEGNPPAEGTAPEGEVLEAPAKGERKGRAPTLKDEARFVRTDVEIKRPKYKMVADGFDVEGGRTVKEALPLIVKAFQDSGRAKSKEFATQESAEAYMRSYIRTVLQAGGIRSLDAVAEVDGGNEEGSSEPEASAPDGSAPEGSAEEGAPREEEVQGA